MKKALFILMLFTAAFAAAEDYSLEDYLVRVERFSKDLTLSRQDVEQADLAVTQARAELFPNISAQASYNRNLGDHEQQTPIGVILPSNPSGFYFLERTDVGVDNQLSLGLQLTQTIFNMRALAGLRASKEVKMISGLIYDETRQSIINGAKKAYYGAALLREILSVRESTERNNYAVYENMKKRYEVGMAQELEVLRAEVTWQTSIPEVTQAKRDLEIALIQIKNLAGIELSEPITLTTPLKTFPGLPEEVAPQESYARRSDYALLAHQREAAEISLDAAEANYYPTVAASLGLSRQGGGNGGTLMDSSTAQNVVQLGVRISLPILSGGRDYAQYKSEKLNLNKHDTEMAKKRDDIQAEITGLYLSLKEAWERIESSKMTVETAEKAYRLARVALENGLATQLEVRESATQLEQIQLLYYSSVYEYLSLYFDWEKALGL
jgi:outer membrane protein TolC